MTPRSQPCLFRFESVPRETLPAAQVESRTRLPPAIPGQVVAPPRVSCPSEGQQTPPRLLRTNEPGWRVAQFKHFGVVHPQLQCPRGVTQVAGYEAERTRKELARQIVSGHGPQHAGLRIGGWRDSATSGHVRHARKPKVMPCVAIRCFARTFVVSRAGRERFRAAPRRTAPTCRPADLPT